METSDLKLVKWNSRRSILGGAIRNAGERKLALEYLEHLAAGHKTKVFLAEHHITWDTLNRYFPPKAYPLIKEALAVGSLLRLRLAEDELFRRAVEGTEEPVYHLGKQVDTVRKYSDRLLELLLKSNDPEKYSDKHQVAVSGQVLSVSITGVARDPKPVSV